MANWTRRSYDALYDWTDKSKRESARKVLIADGLGDVVSRLDEAKTLGVWYSITQEAVASVGPGVIADAAIDAEKQLTSIAKALGSKGGSSKSKIKISAARANGALGGRPPKKRA